MFSNVLEASSALPGDGKASEPCRPCACLSLWLDRFPEAGPDSFLFPYHKVGLAGNSRLPVLYRRRSQTSDRFLAQGVANRV